MLNSTILYYSANAEDEVFTENIRKNILKHSNDLPIVSVTQKPIDFGKNICVGEHDNCYHNGARQVQIGLLEIDTPYVIVTNADTLYPPEYFQFQTTERGHVYRYNNVWVHYMQFNGKPKFWFKGISHCAQMLDREAWFRRIYKSIGKLPRWRIDKTATIPSIHFRGYKHMTIGNPVITFKTGHGVKGNTATKRGHLPKYSLPYWGEANELREKMFK